MSEYDIRGRHYAADFYGVNKTLLDSEMFLRLTLENAAKRCGATVLETVSKKFEPNGVTVACILSESHITCHTYPDKEFIAIDCYTCGDNCDPKIAIDYLVYILMPEESEIQFITRGNRGR